MINQLIKIVQYGIIFLVLVKKYIPHIDYLKLIQGLKNRVRCVRLYAKVYLTYMRQILKTSTILYILFHMRVSSVRDTHFPSFET